MKLLVNRSALLPALQALNSVVERRQTLPVLSNVLLMSDGERLALTATDMEVELQVRLELRMPEGFSTTLPARKLLDICKSLPDEAAIEINFSGEQATLRSGKSRFRLATLPAQEFPTFGELEPKVSLDLDSGLLRRLLARTQFAMAHQDVRYYLNGMLLEMRPSGLRAVATDGHRLALADAAAEVSLAEEEGLHQIIVPRKGVQELARLLSVAEGRVRIAVGSNQLTASAANQQMSSKLIDGRFPDYERVLPQAGDKVVLADRRQLREGLSRASILSNDKFKGVRLVLADQVLRALTHNPEQEEAEEEIEVEYGGAPLEIGFNVSYLLDVIDAMDSEKVRLEFSDAASSCLLRPDSEEDSRYVVMPMRL